MADISFEISAVDKFSKIFDDLEKNVSGVADISKTAGTALTAMGVAGAAGLAAVTKMAGDYDGLMRNVNTMTQLGEEQFNSMKNEVIDLSKRVPESAGKLAEGLYGVVSAGVPAVDQISFLETAAKAAAAGISDTGTAVNATTGLIKAYGLEFSAAESISDKLFQTVKLGQTTFDEMASSVGGVAPIAGQLGVSMDELMAVYATLTGVTGNTSEVTTQFKGALSNILKPSAQAAELAEELGLEFNAAAIQSKGFAGFLEDVKTATGGNSEQMATLFGSTEALGLMMALTGEQSADFTAKLEEMAGSAGAMTDAFEEQSKSLGAQWQVMKNQLFAVAETLGRQFLPYAIQAVQWISNIVSRITELNPNLTTMAAAVMAGVTAFGLIVGPILLAIGFLPTLTAGMTALAGVVGLTAGGLIILSAKILAVVAVLATIGAALVYAYKHVDWFRNGIDTAWEQIKNAFDSALVFIKNVVNNVMTAVSSFIGAQLEKITAFWDENGAMIVQATQNVFNVIRTVIETVLGAVWAVMKFVWPAVQALVEMTWNAIKGVIEGVINVILGIVKFFAALFTGNWSAMWDAVKQIVSGALQAVWNFIQLGLIGRVMGVVKTFSTLFRGAFSSVFSTVANIVKGSIARVKGFISDGIKGALNIINGLKNSFFNAGKGLIDMIVKGITSSISKVTDAITNVTSTIRNMLPFSPAKDGPMIEGDEQTRQNAENGAMLVKHFSNADIKIDLGGAMVI
ncbi:phage tail tape measure protein [Halalkalibacter urbisdiaboli]|uniref:phage tail tape measure protein n=1 Tax=Halalkalibacter urbisdiaboli TaxID=1960589 RepID=UPI000B42FF80|nr:phage tail tape measure protein [Halalkalibacter urbisdiaboli]